MVKKKVILTEKAPKPLGPYSQAIQAGNTLYVSGQVGIDPSTGKVVEGGIQAQTKQALENIRKILAEVGMTPENAVKASVFITKAEDFKPMNEVYTQFFKENFPARTTVIAKLASDQLLVEIDLIAQA
ncbi:MAG: Rid family detoxifying hydrolase [Nitrososphaeria archaeon]